MTPAAQRFVQTLLEQGQSIFTSGTLYALEHPDEPVRLYDQEGRHLETVCGELRLWWVTPEWERHELRLAAYELVQSLIEQAPWPSVDLTVVPPEQTKGIPPDALQVLLGRTLTDEEIERILEEDREILGELAQH